MGRKIIAACAFALMAGAAGMAIADDRDEREDGAKGSPQNITGTAKALKRLEAKRERRRAKFYFPNQDYRTIDGSDNNLGDPAMGEALTQLSRLASSKYPDGVSSMTYPNRPGARHISNAVFDQGEQSTPNPFHKSDFVWQWGQFLDHDLSLSDAAAEFGDAPIPVPANDPDFAPSPMIPFSRAIFDPETGENAAPQSPREQINQITSWIDASNVYGSDEERAEALRGKHGRLKSGRKFLLPKNRAGLENANGPGFLPPEKMFLAGDVRANEQVGLAVMHALFVREHNRLARQVRWNFPWLDEDGVYEVTRKLVAAQMQIITYNEFLPALLGPYAPGLESEYDPDLSGAIMNEFSVAAFRFGHSAVNSKLLRLKRNGRPHRDGHLSLRDSFFNAPLILKKPHDLDPILRGLAAQKHQEIDAKVIDDLRNFLFGPPGAGGLDLASLNIQRGRDHGVPSYNDMREKMGLSRITQFSDFPADTQTQIDLSDAYASTDDIDLWAGGLAESAHGGSQLGPLFTAILVEQFVRLRDGDRYWHTRTLNWREKRLIRGVTLAKIIRANTGIGNELQDDVFSVPE
ncbi:MAG: peroxidase family protein [Pseudomonadota bacterium]